MSNALEFDFVDDASGGRFMPVGGPIIQLRQLLARGEVDTAVRIYEETGSSARDELIQEGLSASFETRKHIATMFKNARDFAGAALVFQAGKHETDAATCFEQAGDFAAAAPCWARAHEVLKAAAAWERAGKTEQALELYRQAGAHERVAECLARGHRYYEASQAFRALNNAHAEIEVLRLGVTAEPGNLEIVSRFAELMLQHGRKEQAAQLLMTTSKVAPGAKDHARFLTLLAAGLEAIGNAPAAVKVRARLAELPPAGEVAPVVPAQAAPATELSADAYGFLKALPMFSELSLTDMKALYRVCTLRQFTPGQHLIEPGQPGKGLFVIVDGQVEIFAGADANARLLNTLGVGGYVGEISLVQDGPTSARVTARSAVKALFIGKDAFRQYLFGAPMAALRIYQLFTFNLAERVRVLSAAK